ncbi:MAG TPA: hypothetical protein VNY05_08740 [Candidatus Acidoferrales bacterium]|jgi:hypothetical protein|nr:hypothetical protein [Candidatus Acidoferrales bacterium]
MKAPTAQTGAEQVREYARVNYIEPARQRHESTVRIIAGDVHKALHLEGRVPSVCQALSGPKFLEENHLTLEKREGPPSGQSTTVVFTYRLADEHRATDELQESPLLRLWGIGKEVFESLGGGEAFIRRERERFYQHDEDV